MMKSRSRWPWSVVGRTAMTLVLVLVVIVSPATAQDEPAVSIVDASLWDKPFSTFGPVPVDESMFADADGSGYGSELALSLLQVETKTLGVFGGPTELDAWGADLSQQDGVHYQGVRPGNSASTDVVTLVRVDTSSLEDACGGTVIEIALSINQPGLPTFTDQAVARNPGNGANLVNSVIMTDCEVETEFRQLVGSTFTQFETRIGSVFADDGIAATVLFYLGPLSAPDGSTSRVSLSVADLVDQGPDRVLSAQTEFFPLPPSVPESIGTRITPGPIDLSVLGGPGSIFAGALGEDAGGSDAVQDEIGDTPEVEALEPAEGGVAPAQTDQPEDSVADDSSGLPAWLLGIIGVTVLAAVTAVVKVGPLAKKSSPTLRGVLKLPAETMGDPADLLLRDARDRGLPVVDAKQKVDFGRASEFRHVEGKDRMYLPEVSVPEEFLAEDVVRDRRWPDLGPPVGVSQTLTFHEPPDVWFETPVSERPRRFAYWVDPETMTMSIGGIDHPEALYEEPPVEYSPEIDGEDPLSTQGDPIS